MPNEYLIETTDAEEFHSKLKARLIECREAECFSMLITRKARSNDFVLCVQVDANKKATRGNFSVIESHRFRFLSVKNGKYSLIGSCRTNARGIENLHAYIHAVMGGVFCKLREEPADDRLLLPLVEAVIDPPAAKPEQKGNTEESE